MDRRAERFCQLVALHEPVLPNRIAAQKAGYSPKNAASAGTQAARLLSRVEVSERIVFLVRNRANEQIATLVAGREERRRLLTEVIRESEEVESRKGTERGQPTDLEIRATRWGLRLAAIKELNEMDGDYPAKRVAVTLQEQLKAAGGITFVFEERVEKPAIEAESTVKRGGAR